MPQNCEVAARSPPLAASDLLTTARPVGYCLRVAGWICDSRWLGERHVVTVFRQKAEAVYRDGIPSSVRNFGGFHDWVAERFGWHESTARWCNIIVEELGGNLGEAPDRFVELVEEYQRTYNAVR